jgi:hypothetical protein
MEGGGERETQREKETDRQREGERGRERGGPETCRDKERARESSGKREGETDRGAGFLNETHPLSYCKPKPAFSVSARDLQDSE